MTGSQVAGQGLPVTFRDVALAKQHTADEVQDASRRKFFFGPARALTALVASMPFARKSLVGTMTPAAPAIMTHTWPFLESWPFPFVQRVLGVSVW